MKLLSNLHRQISLNRLIFFLVFNKVALTGDEYIFTSAIEDVHDYRKIEEHILNFVNTKVGVHTTNFGRSVNEAQVEDACVWEGDKRLTVYVTGVNQSVCVMYGVRLTLMHYDTVCDDYKPQVIW